MSLIQAKQLTRYYSAHCAVDHISFTLDKGDILGFLGPNGAGKSTTMQMLAGTLAPGEGSIHIDGIDLLEQPKAAKAALGYLPEQPPVYRELTVNEYLTYCARLHRVANDAVTDAVELAMQRCGLLDVRKRLIGNLSKGYQQRVGIAQAIVHAPKVIILDEPTVGLDPIQIREIRELIRELGREHGIILSTHILPEVQAVCNRVQIMHQGRLVFESAMDALRENTDGRYRVSLRATVSHDQLTALSVVESAQPEDDGFVVTLNDRADVFSDVVAQQGWGLTRLMPVQQSLEQIFVQLTQQEQAA